MSEADLNEEYDEEDECELTPEEALDLIQRRVENIQVGFTTQGWDMSEPEIVLTEILACAMHWADARGLDFESCLEEAEDFYSFERFEAGEEAVDQAHRDWNDSMQSLKPRPESSSPGGECGQ
jgi:hypothetical protein